MVTIEDDVENKQTYIQFQNVTITITELGRNCEYTCASLYIHIVFIVQSHNIHVTMSVQHTCTLTKGTAHGIQVP